MLNFLSVCVWRARQVLSCEFRQCLNVVSNLMLCFFGGFINLKSGSDAFYLKEHQFLYSQFIAGTGGHIW
jgi:hypothetical protein